MTANATMIEILENRATEQGERPAYVFLSYGETGVAEEQVSFADLDARARAIGASLQAAGAGGGERVALLFPPGPDFVASFFGCLYAGAVAVPALPPRKRGADPRLAAICRDARPRVALTSAGLLPALESAAAQIPELAAAVRMAPVTASIETMGADWRRPDLRPESLAFLQYTSGSTSTPKGVMVSHGNLVHNEELIRQTFEQSSDSVVLGWLPLYHDMGLIGTMLQPLYAGAVGYLMTPGAFLQRPARWLEAISRYRATTSGGPNFAYELCVRKIGEAEREGLDLSSWRVAFNGAEPVRAGTLRRFAEAFAPCGFRASAFRPCYGLAEATLLVSGLRPEGEPRVHSLDAEALERHEAVGSGEVGDAARVRELVGCGAAMQTVVIVEAESGEPCAPGRVGEVWVSSPSVAHGYWERPEETAATFGARLADGSGPFLRTGDLGFLAEGELYLTGRLKDLIILRGRNHYPQDLELTAERSHADLRATGGAAFAVEGGGEAGEERLVIVHEVDRHARAGLNAERAEEIAAAVRQRVAEEHEVSVAEVVLIGPETLPRTSSGKVRRRACRDLYLQGGLRVLGTSRLSPAAADEVVESEVRTGSADWLRRAFAAAARIDPARIDPDLPLSASGLDSLAAVELKQVVEEASGVSLPLGDLLEGMTLRELEARVGAPGVETPGYEKKAFLRKNAGSPELDGAGEHPLSWNQRSLWFLHLLAPQSSAYNITGAARLEASSVDALARALQGLVDRHPMLRARFADSPGGPVQRVAASPDPHPLDPPLPHALPPPGRGGRTAKAEERSFLSWEGGSPLPGGGSACGRGAGGEGPAEPLALQARSEAGFEVLEADGWSDADIQARLQAEAFRPFDFAAGPLLRATLLRRGDEAFLALAVHHIAADFWSMAVLARELGALAAGETLPAPTALYTDFAREQERMLASPAGERLWEHWRERLTGTPQLDLPTDRPRRPVQILRGGYRTLSPSMERAEAVHRLAAAHGCTPFVALLAAWQAVLSRWSGQEEFLSGAPMAGRSSRSWAEVVGYFVNLVPLRADLSGDPAVGELMARTRGTVLDALAHQDFPFALLTERLQPERDPSRPPLVAAMLTFEKSPAPELAALAAFAVGVPGVRLDLGGLALESLPLEPPAAQLDLALAAAELPAGLAVSLQWDADLFDASTVGRMLGHLDRLLVEMAAGDRSVSELRLLSAEERDQILLSWSGAESAPAGAGCLHELFEAQVARTPEATALIVGEERWTYDVLNRRANRLAHHLRGLGAGPEQRVGVLMRRSGELIVALLGILKSGAAYVPLDPNYPGEWLDHAAQDADIALLLTEEGSAGKLAAGRREVFATAEAISREPESNPEPLAGHGSLAYVIYTSGSTGRPKGVALEHRGAVERMLWAREAFPAEDLAGVLAATSICFDLSVFEIFAPLSWGGTVILADNALALPSLPARDEVTLVNTVPSAITELAAGELPPALRTVNLAGEALMPHLVERIYRHPQVGQVFNLYGPTEDTTYSTGIRVEKGAARVSIGRPLPGTRAYVLDRRLQPVPGGVPGELFLAGAGGARGYFGRPDLTAEKFIPDPFATIPGGRLYRTGDLARWLPSGELEHLGRIDHQVKVRGFRIELGEIEAALLAHPGVQQAVVIVREVAGSKSLVAYVAGDQPAGEILPAAPALREHLRSRLPEHMVPAFFVQLPALPLTPNGKVNRKALPAPVVPVTGPAEGRLSGTEEAVAAIWCEVLGLPRVGGEDNFFDLGGHSLLLLRVQAHLRERLGREVTLVDLLTHTTVRALARHLETGLVVAEPAPRTSRKRGAGSGGVGAVAIVGLAGRFPGASDVESLWTNLCGGVSSIARLSDEELAAAGVAPELRRDPRYVPAAGLLDGVELFDAGFFGYSPREAELMDPQQRLFLECAWEALEDAGYDSRRTPGPVGVFASLGFNRYLHQVLTAVDPAEVGALQLALGNDKDFLATRVSYKLDLTGPSMTVQTACSSSLVAVHTACRNLQQGDCDMALAGGVSIVLPQRAGYLYEEGGIASPDGCCRAFDASARGTVFGSGTGIVVLKRLEDALADGDTIRAVLLGSAVNNDGGTGKAGYTAPSVAGQAAVVSAALEAAGVDPATVSYVEAHGTGTPLGDPIEVQALAQAFRRGGAREGSCALGSVKSNLGHLDTAAGVTGLIKTVLALQHGVLPPSLGFSQPNPQIDFAAGPFHVQSELAAWERGAAPRRAGVSSFGIGGTNVHAVLEEPPAVPPSESARPWHLLVLSARTPEALERKRLELADHLERHPEIHLADAAFTLQLGRRPFAHRCTVTGRDGADAAAALRGETPGRLFERTAPETAPPVVFLFPGQGSQRPGMGAGLYRTEPVFRQEIDRCCEILLPLLGFDLRDLLLAPAESEDAARRLAATEVTQPALFVIEHALARLWMSWGVRPEALIGHSIGEYVAACLAGVFSLEDALALVAARGRLVGSLPAGAMLAVSLPEAEAARRAEESGLAVAAVNAPDACVLSGPAKAVEQLAGRLAAEGVEHRRLQTSHAFHSPALEPILDRFRAEVARLDLQTPRLPWISNLSGTWIRPDEATDPGYWTRHLREAVRFADGVEELLRVPGRVYLEVGPGRALSTLVRRRLARGEEGAILASLARTTEPEEDVRQVGEALGRLWLAGVEIDWTAVHAHERRRRIPLPAYPFERQRYWIEGRIEGIQGGIAARNPVRTDRRREIDEWLYAPAWRRTPPPARPIAAAEAGVWLLLADANGLVRALAERLERLGHDAVLVEANEEADFAELLNALREEGREPAHIVHGWSLGQQRPEDEDFEQAQELGLHSLLSLVRALATLPSRSVRLCVLSNGLHEVTGSEELRPAQAGLAAVARVIPQEHPEIACRVIDLERVPAARSRDMDLLLSEVAGPESDPLVAFRGGHRWVQSWEPVRSGVSRAEPIELRPRGVYLITGGLGKIGLTLAELLAESVQARLVLVGRTPVPEREAWPRRLLDIEAMGSEILPLSADVTDPWALEGAVRQAEKRFGRLDGVIHAAARISFQTLEETGPEECAAAFDAKVRGARALAEVLRGRNLDFVLAFSSLSAVLGGLGFAAYAAANACLDAFVLRHRRGVATPWITVGWDGWRFPGDASPAGAARGTAMTPEEGTEIFRRILALGPLPHLAVSTTDLEARLDQWVRGASRLSAASPASPEASLHARPELRSSYEAPRSATESALAGLWQGLLGVDRIGAHDDFFELGGHSLMATQLSTRIRETFGAVLSLRDLFEAPTLAGLAARIDAARQTGGEPGIPPLVRVPREGALPLSFAQQRLWVADQLEPGSAVYNIAVALRIEGPLNAAALAATLGEIVRRHEALRTVFAAPDGVPVQVIQPARPFPLPLVDLSALPEDRREPQALALARDEAGRPFDLSQGPLLRGLLLRLADPSEGRADHLVALPMHHIVSDGWSMGILVREVAALYPAFAAERPSPLPELPVQYADFAAWQRSWLSGAVLESEISFWRQQLAGLPPLLELPTDRPRPAAQSYRGASRPVRLPVELVRGAEALGRREGATLFMVLLAAFQALLARSSGQEDLAVGTPMAGRNRMETEGLIGFFVNTLVLRGDLSGAPRFTELLGRVRETALAAHLHQDVPFEKLVEELAPERTLAHAPLFQAMLVLQNAPFEDLEIRDLRLRPVHVAAATAKFDLTMSLEEQDGGLTGTVAYATDLYDAATVDRLITGFELLLAGMAARPESRVGEVSLLTEAEARQILEEWNDTRVEGLAEGCLHHVVARQAARTPSAVALELGDEQWTYRRLVSSARFLARHLRELGVGPDEVVGLCADRSPAMIVGMLAILEAGGAWLPLDPTYPAERLAFMLEDSGARVLLLQQHLREQVAAAAADPRSLHSLHMVPLDDRWSLDAETEPLGVEVTPDHLAYVIYTSGSTGRPKGVMVPHGAICNRVGWAQQLFRLDERDAVLQKASFGFDFSVWECFAPLWAGARLVLAEPGRQGDVPYLLRVLREHRVTIVHFVPSMLAAFLAEEGVEACDSLRQVFSGGEALTPDLRDRALARLPARLENEYGPTETAVDSTSWACAPGQSPHRVPIGRPISNTQVYVVDPELRPVPIGVAGELLVGGAGVTRGYLRRPGLTAERFIPDPFGGLSGARLYRTGDLARWLPDGSIDFLGRLDHQVKLRGLRIELGEIEAALVALPDVHQAVVLVRESRLIAYVVGAAGHAGHAGDIAAEDLRRSLRERLPDYMVPAVFVALPALPLNASGKVDRKALPAPEQPGAREESYVAPRTRQEEILAEVWAQVLSLPRVGVNDNFFELGGDSILSIQIVARARKAGLLFTVREIFEHQTVAGLARHATVTEAAGAALDGQGPIVGEVPLTPIQRRFFAQGPVDPHHFNQALLLEPREPLAPAILERAMAVLVEHHDALRMRFHGDRQENAPAEPVAPFSRIDLSGLPASRRHEAFERGAAALQAGFDLAAGPLTRLCSFEAGTGEPSRLLWVTHHLVVDGVSWRVLLEDLEAACGQMELPPKTTSFQEWARRLAGHAGSESLTRELEHWRETVRVPAPRLPVDVPAAEGGGLVGDEATVSVELSTEETTDLLQTVPSVYHSRIDEALLSALVRALAGWTGLPRLRVDLEGHGREPVFGDGDDVDVSRTVGWFTSLYPVVLEAGDADPGAALVSAKERLRAIPGRGIGYGLLESAGLLEPAPAEILFNYLGQAGASAGESSLFRVSTVTPGASRSPRALRTHPLAINSLVTEGRLRITLTYGTRTHHRETVERLAAAYAGALRQLLQHSRKSEEVFTPSDFPKARLNARSLSKVAALLAESD